jgi:hypothetical protein
MHHHLIIHYIRLLWAILPTSSFDMDFRFDLVDSTPSGNKEYMALSFSLQRRSGTEMAGIFHQAAAYGVLQLVALVLIRC